MWASAIVKGQISANADAGLGHCLVSVEIDFLVFDRSPQPLDEDIVPPRTLAIHRDGDLRLLKHGGEVDGGELRTLVGVEYFGLAIAGKRFLDCFDAEGSFHRDRQPPRQNPPAEPVHDGAEIDKATRHQDVGYVHCPDLVGPGDRQLSQEVGIDFVRWHWLRGVRAAIDCLNAHFFHQRCDVQLSGL